MNMLSNGVVSLVSGVLFGAGMIVSGMADPSVVISFLDVTGDWDPSLIFVMGGALAIFAPVYHIVIKKRKKAVNGTEYNWPKSPKVDRKLVTGSIIFGIGWGIAGICPGPAVSSLSGGSTIIITFVLCMLAGMAMANIYTRKQC